MTIVNPNIHVRVGVLPKNSGFWVRPARCYVIASAWAGAVVRNHLGAFYRGISGSEGHFLQRENIITFPTGGH